MTLVLAEAERNIKIAVEDKIKNTKKFAYSCGFFLLKISFQLKTTTKKHKKHKISLQTIQCIL